MRELFNKVKGSGAPDGTHLLVRCSGSDPRADVHSWLLSVYWNLSPFCYSLSPVLHICTNLDAHLQTVDFNSDVLMKKKKIAREMLKSFLNQ